MLSPPACITVVLPTFNRRHWLQRAVESVLQETRIPIQLHIFDNASTDETEAYVRHVMASDSRVSYTRQPENIGALPNYRQAFESISTEYFVPLADDDWLFPDFLHSAYQQMASQPETGAVVFKTDFRDEQDTPLPNSENHPDRPFSGLMDPPGHLRAWMSYGHYMSWSSILWRTRVLDCIPRPFFAIGLNADVEFQMLVFLHHPVFLIDARGSVYLSHGNNASGNFDVSHITSWARLFEQLDDYRDRLGFFEDAEYARLREIVMERYRPFWNAPAKSELPYEQLLPLAHAAAIRLGDWNLGFSLLEKLYEFHHEASTLQMPPGADRVKIGPGAFADLVRNHGVFPLPVSWFTYLSISGASPTDLHTEVERSKRALVAEKNQKKLLLKQLRLELGQVTSDMEDSIKTLYSSRWWKWARFFLSPLKRKQNRNYPPLDRIHEELERIASTLKDRDADPLP